MCPNYQARDNQGLHIKQKKRRIFPFSKQHDCLFKQMISYILICTCMSKHSKRCHKNLPPSSKNQQSRNDLHREQ